MKIQVIQTLPNGLVEKQILTKELNAVLKVQVQPNAKVSLAVEGAKTGNVKKSGKNLVLEADGEELLEVTDFYETAGASVGDVSWNFAATDGTVSPEASTVVASDSSAAALSASDTSVGGLFPISPVWMGSAAAGAAAVLLSAAGGGAAAASIGSTVVNGSIVLGPVVTAHGLVVELFTANGTLLTTATVDQAGKFTATFSASYAGPVLARVKDTTANADYQDEATASAKDLTTDIRAAFSSAGAGTINITLSPLSELAVRELVGDTGGDAGASGVVLGTLNTSALILAKNKEIAADFGLAGTGAVPANVVTDFLVNPTVDQSGGSTLITANYAGYVLAALSGLDGIYGGTSGAIARLAGSTTPAQTNNLIALGAGQGVGLTAGLAAIIGGDVSTAYTAAVNTSTTLNTSHTAAFTVSELSALSPLTISLLSTAQIGYITNLAALSIEQLGALTATQVGVLTTAQITNLTGPQIAALILDVASLQTAQLNLLTAAQTQGLTANQLDALALPTLTLSGADNVGTASTISPGGLTNDAALTFSGAFTGRIPPNAGIYIYLDGSSTPLSGTATVSGGTWSYTPSSSAITGQSSHSVIAKLGVMGGNSAATATAAFDYVLDTIAPTIAARPVPFSAAENQLVVGIVSATDTNGVAWSIDGGGADDSKFSINSTTGALTFQSAKDYESPDDAGANRGYVVRVKATDLAGNSSTSDITVNLTDVNDAPEAAAPTIALQTAVHNANFSLAMASYFRDADAGGLTGGTYSATGLGNGISINSSTGVISGLPTADAASTSIVVKFTDAGGLFITKSFNLQAVTAPTVSSFRVSDATGTSTVGKGGDALTFVLTMSEIVTITTTAPATAPTIEFTLNGTTATATYASGSGTSALTFTATAPATGNGTAISITGINLHSSTAIGSTSGQGWATSATGQTYSGYTVDNTAPTISTTSLDSNENATAVGTVAGSDTNGITWSIDGTGSDDTKFNITAAGVLSFASAKNFESPDDTGGTAGDGTYVVKVKATDGAGNTTSSNVNVVLKNVNEAPVAAAPAIGLQSAVHNVNFSLAMASYFSDIDSGGLTGGTYSATGLGNGISINSSTGVISGLPTADAASTSIVVKFTDAGGLFITKSFNLQAVTAPTVSSFRVSDATGTSTVGKGGDALTFVLTMSEIVTITTTLPATAPTIEFTLNGTTATATYASGSGTSALTFTATAPATGNGTAISITGINLHSSTAIGSTSGQGWATSATGQTYSGYTVDNTAPTISTTSLDSNENATAVGTVAGSDTNGITWSIDGTGSDDTKFNITAAGVLSFASAKNFESPDDTGGTVGDGTYVVKVKATDGAGNTTSSNVNVVLKNVNEAPVAAVPTIALQTAVHNVNFSLAMASYFSDIDSGGLTGGTYSATGLGNGISINSSTGVISGFPTADAASTPIVVKFTDAGGLFITKSFNLQAVTAPTVSSFTVSDAIGSSAVVGSYLLGTGGNTLTFTLTMSEAVTIATTPPNTVPTVQFTLNGTAITATYASGSGTASLVFTGTAPSTGDGSAISITGINLNGSTATGGSTSQQWLTSVTGQTYASYTVDNTAPYYINNLLRFGENTTADTARIFFDVNADELNGPVTYSNLGVLVGSGDHDSSSFSLSSAGVLTFSTYVNFEDPQDNGRNGIYDISFTATDAVGLSANLLVQLKAYDVNEAPTSTGSIGNKTIIYGHTYTALAPLVDVSSFFTDPDDSAVLTYTATGLDSGLSIDLNTGLITGTSYSIHSAAPVVITAHDHYGRTTDLTVSQTLQFQTAYEPVLSSNLSNVTNLDVRSKIVFRTTENLDLSQVGTYTITIKNEANTSATGKAGFGESQDHTQTITVTNGVVSGDGAISFGNGVVIVDPLYDLDISNNYSLSISDGVFVGTTTGLSTTAFTSIRFSTITPGSSATLIADDWCNTGYGFSGTANLSQIMSVTTGAMLDSGKWLSLSSVPNRDPTDSYGVRTPTLDATDSDYVYVYRDKDPSVNNIAIADTAIHIANFNAKDLIYIDNQDQQVLAQNYIYENVFALGTGAFNDPWNATWDGDSLTTEIYMSLDAATRLLLPSVYTPLIHSFNNPVWSETGVVITA